MPTTEENLQAAFAGESQANRKYLAFAKKADAEGYPQVARLFRAAAEAETIHAHSHLAALKGVGSTEENLKAAVAGETFEFESMYPEMIKKAEEDGNKTAERSFKFANEVEKVHAALYQSLLDSLGDEAQEEYSYLICPVCGHTVANEAPERCPVCNAKGSRFYKVD
jgi:rubrerythrin